MNAPTAPNTNHAPTMPAIHTAFHFLSNARAGRLATSMTAQTTTASDPRVMKSNSMLPMFPLSVESRTVHQSTTFFQKTSYLSNL